MIWKYIGLYEHNKTENSPYDCNAYLVDSSILIDVGMESGSIITQLKDHIKPGQLKYIILTHCHYDHSGGVVEVACAYGAKIAIHTEDASLVSNSCASASELFGKKAPLFVPDILLKGGETFGELEVIHTPGHTPGGICLFSETSKVLFSGDTVFEDGSFGRTDLFGGNSEKLIGSIRKLTSLNVMEMYPGHGDVVTKDAKGQIKLSLTMATQFQIEILFLGDTVLKARGLFYIITGQIQ